MSAWEIHPDWNVEKVRAHLDSLAEDAVRHRIARDAFQDAADEADRDLSRTERQLASAQEVFRGPRKAADS